MHLMAYIQINYNNKEAIILPLSSFRKGKMYDYYFPDFYGC